LANGASTWREGGLQLLRSSKGSPRLGGGGNCRKTDDCTITRIKERELGDQNVGIKCDSSWATIIPAPERKQERRFRMNMIGERNGWEGLQLKSTSWENAPKHGFTTVFFNSLTKEEKGRVKCHAMKKKSGVEERNKVGQSASQEEKG